MDIDQMKALYPQITAAIIELAYDNGVVNRGTTEESIVARVLPEFVTWPSAQLVEQELDALYAEARSALLTGDEADRPVVLPQTEAMLEAIFDAL